LITLDTDILIEIFDRKSVIGDEVLREILRSGERISTTVVNLHEILYGLHKYAKPSTDVSALPVLDYTKRDATLSAELEFGAERKGSPIRRTDAMIAAITINNRASLYTLDIKHFQPLRAFGLKLFP